MNVRGPEKPRRLEGVRRSVARHLRGDYREVSVAHLLALSDKACAAVGKSRACPLHTAGSLRGDPALALREQASHLRKEVGHRRALPTKGVDPLESLEYLPGLVHASKLEGKNARVCHGVCRGFRQSRQ
jgi:hypothetical protein